MRRRRWVLGGCASAVLALAASTAIGEEPSLEVHLQPTRFGVDDLAQLTVRINEPPPDLGAPKLGEMVNLEIVGGPSTGSEFSFVNGVASRSQTFTYAVRARAPGQASVKSVTARVGNAELRAGPVTAEVVEGSIAPRSRPGPRSPFGGDPFGQLRPRRAPPRAEVVLRHVLSSQDVTVGQPLVATVYLDSTVSSVSGFEWVTPPSYPGFWAQRLDNPDQVVPEQVDVDGTRFYRYRVMRSVLVPLKAGRIEVAAVEASIGVRSWGLFDSGQLIERSTPARTVEVTPRPEAPPGFSGAVGDLRYSASIEPAEIDDGQSAVVTITLEGRGNLPLVETPAVWPSCADCDTYPPEEDSRVTVDDSGIHGSRTWQVTVVPRRSGSIELGAVDLAVFDPAAGRYLNQTVGPLALEVAAPPPTPTPVVTPIPRTGDGAGRVVSEPRHGGSSIPAWLLSFGALFIGLTAGAAVTWALTRRRSTIAMPPRRSDQNPAERARELQLTLERWWMDARTTSRGVALEDDMLKLRRDLESVRFAPGRADHSHTVEDLELRLKRLMRRP